MEKWEQFSKEELEQIIKESNTYKEVLEKIGYPTYSTKNKIVKKICEKYNFSIEHFSHTTLTDLTGKRYGRLQVLYRDMSKPKGHQKPVYWICQCDCGNVVSIKTYSLTSGNTKSCGCHQKQRTSEARKLNLIGQRFGKLIVIKEVPSIVEESGQKRTAWLCQCDCGNQVVVKTINLRSGDTKSCGCIFSAGEHRIEYLLNKMKINYKKEYSFKDLRTEKIIVCVLTSLFLKTQNLFV